jgi:hypothetical protein
MNILWYLLSAMLGIGAVILLVFLITSNTPLAPWLGKLFWRGRAPLSVIAAVYLLFIVNEFFSARHARERRESAKESQERSFFFLNEMFKAQRNMYLVISGLAVYLGILLISYQVQLWAARIDREKTRLSKTD